MWQDNVPTLVNLGMRVTCYDGRGVGRRSSPAEWPWRADADLLAVLDAAGVERTVLCGASDGGRLALDVVAGHLARVSGLVIVGTAIAELPDPADDEKAALAELFTALKPREDAAAAGDMTAAFTADLAVWAPALDPQARQRLIAICLDSGNPFAPDRVWPLPIDPPGIARLGEITVPTLIIVGEQDVALSHLTARRIAAGVAGAELAVIMDADHLVSAGKPAEFNRLVSDFCQRVSQGAARSGSRD